MGMGGAHGPLFAALWVLAACGPLQVWDDHLTWTTFILKVFNLNIKTFYFTALQRSIFMHWVYKDAVSVFLPCNSEGEIKVTYTTALFEPL